MPMPDIIVAREGSAREERRAFSAALAEVQGARRRVPALLVGEPEWRAESDHRRQSADELQRASGHLGVHEARGLKGLSN
jgi:hypothetical protein